MRAALAARVSTRDKNQDPELQLVPMREFANARGWTVRGEYVDHAGASDFVGRTQWARLLEDVRRRRVDLVAVWKLDRAFRSAIECLSTLAHGYLARVAAPQGPGRPSVGFRVNPLSQNPRNTQNQASPGVIADSAGFALRRPGEARR
jgi:hypothetical protein